MSEIKKSINSVQCVGTVSELNFKKEIKEVELKDKNGNSHKVTCGVIGKEEFANPNITVNCNGSMVGFSFFPTNEKMYDKDNKLVDNPRYKALLSIMEYDNGTRVKVDGSFADGGYPSKDATTNEYKWTDRISLNAFSVTSTNVPDEDYCDCDITGVITNLKKETKKGEDDDAEETGRLLVDIIFFDYNGNAVPFNNIIADNDMALDDGSTFDMAEAFEDAYKKGDSVKLSLEVVTVHKGAVRVGGGMGRTSHKTSGYDVTEYRIFGCPSVPLTTDTEEEGYAEVRLYTDYVVDKAMAKQALSERETMKEQRCNDRAKKDSEGGTSKAKSKGLNGRASKKNDDEEFLSAKDLEDDPFSDDLF